MRPEPSRYFASHFGDSITIRIELSLPVVSFAVRFLPAVSSHLTNCCPERSNRSAFGGTGFVNVFLRSDPIVNLSRKYHSRRTELPSSLSPRLWQRFVVRGEYYSQRYIYQSVLSTTTIGDCCDIAQLLGHTFYPLPPSTRISDRS